MSFLLLGAQNHVCAQDQGIRIEVGSPHYSVYQWTTENGLAQNNVSQILEGPGGFLWIGTYNGLVRFDGYEFKTYDEGNTLGMTSSFILSMAKSKDGSIWLSTENELLQITENKPKVILRTLKNDIKLASANGVVYAKSRNGIYAYEEHWKLILSYTQDRFNRIHENANQIMLFSGDSLFKLKKGELNFIGIQPKLSYINHEIYRSENNENEVNYFIIKDNHLETYKDYKHLIYSPLKGKTEFAFSIVKGELNNSVTFFDSFLKIENESNSEVFDLNTNFGNNNLRSVYLAPNGIIWVGTISSGLFMFYPKTFKTIATSTKDNKNGYMVYQAQDSIIWFDEPCESVFAMKTDQSVQKYDINLCTWTMAQDSNQNTWIGRYKGLYKFNNEMKNIGFSPYQNDLDGKYTYSIYKRKDETLIIGTNEGIFYMTHDSLFTINKSENLGKVYSFYEDRNENLFACGENGLILLDTTKIHKVFSTLDGLPTNDIRSIYQDEDLNYWVGTSQKGLCFYNSALGLKQLPTEGGRLNKNIWCIVEDDFGYLWMNSNQGIYRANRNDLIEFVEGKNPGFSTRHFTTADGLENSEGNSRTQNKAFKSYTGEIWFSMISGPAFIDPQKINETTLSHPIVIDEVFIDKKRIDTQSEIIIGPEQSQIQFSFSHPIFIQASHLDYYYKIDGLDGRWFEVGRSRLMTFSELPAGDFILRIKQIGSENETHIKFTVKVNLWETDLFKIFIVFLLTSILFLIGFRVWQKNRKGRAEIKRMRFDLKSLELRALQSQMNPHFIFNCLSSIQSLFILGDLNRANEYMSQFSALLRLILEHAQKPLITLKEDLDMFNIYVPLERMQFDKPFEFNLNVDQGIEPELYLIPSMVTHTFIENAIKHGLKPLKEREGKLTIHVSKHESNLVIAIKDNGIGYERSLLTKKTNPSRHKSRGLEITNRRIDLLNLLNDLDIQVTIFDLKDEKNKPCGTEIRLLFPNIQKDEDINYR